MEVLAGFLGGVAGVIGFLPFLFLSGRLRTKFIEEGAKKAAYIFLVPLLSFILMVAALFVLWLAFPQHLMVFSVACIVVFLGGTIAVTVKQVRR
ncbi:MAG: hypothetical protein FWG23_07580 [Eggerthellaceae bacterium]|nr:hypothetical protein [Eggerthellaceae bacterium]MDR2716069.1 hypothetical protein [Coriobacteriaceae bacterium]